MGLPGGSVVKNPPANTGGLASIPGLQRFPGEGNGNPLQCLTWKIPLDLEDPGVLQSMGSQRTGYDLMTKQQQLYLIQEPK